MDWFEKLTGFREAGYEETRNRLEIQGDRLHSRVNGASYGIGALELVSLSSLRERALRSDRSGGRSKTTLVRGDVRRMHHDPANVGALFQVASQFNLLEMVDPDITPEDGVTRYQHDHTQGPACAIAAGAATIYRNYFVPAEGGLGQTSSRQLNGLIDVGAALAAAVDLPVRQLWNLKNGYALCSQMGLDAISKHLGSITPSQLDDLRGKLRVGLHSDVEVTDAPGPNRPVVSQVFCSALPVAYSGLSRGPWAPFASLILEAAYEATMWSAVLNARRGASNVVLLTLLGGGAFGNDEAWILAALRRALTLTSQFDLDVRLVSFGAPSPATRSVVSDFS